MTPGATYSPGRWLALVAPTVAVLIEPGLPGARLDELWRTVQAQQGADPVLAVISKADADGRPAFALAALDGSSVRLIVRGPVQLTVQEELGREREIPVAGEHAWGEETVSVSDVLWFVRPGGRADGVALPIVSGAVLTDVLVWQATVVRPLKAVPLPGPRETPVAVRRSAGLGSHPRRRYGAWDWSLAPVPGASARADLGAGVDTAVPDTRDVPTVRPEVPNGAVPLPETHTGQEPEPLVEQRADDEAAVENESPTGVPVAHAPEGGEVLPEPPPLPGSEPEPRARVRCGVLEFDDGERVDVDGPVIIGRAPSQVEGDRPARLVPVPEANRGLSRNHVRIDVGLHGPFVVDLGSRNGTTMRSPGRTAVRLDPWMPYPLDSGAELVFAQIICTFRDHDQSSESE